MGSASRKSNATTRVVRAFTYARSCALLVQCVSHVCLRPEQTLEALGTQLGEARRVQPSDPTVGNKQGFVVQHFVEFVWASMALSCHSTSLGQTNDGTDFGRRELRHTCSQP